MLRSNFLDQIRAESQLPKEDRSIWRALTRAFGWLLVPALVNKVVGDVLAFVQPLALGGIIDYIGAIDDGGDGDEFGGLGLGWWWTIALVVASIAQNALLQNHHHMSMRVGMRVRAAIQAVVYSKSMSVASAAREIVGMG